MIQCVLGFLVDDCAPMDTKITRNPCENNMLTNSDKAFYKFQLFLKWKGLSFTTLDCQQARKRIRTDHEFTFFRRGNELQSKKYCIRFCTEDRTVRNQLPMRVFRCYWEIEVVKFALVCFLGDTRVVVKRI
jgi:hypothetical protein